MQNMYPGMINSPTTEIVNAITDTDTTIEVLNGDALPDAPNIAVIGQGENCETIQYNEKTGNVLLDIIRGFQGTAQSWSANTRIARNFTAYDHDAARQNISELDGRTTNIENNIAETKNAQAAPIGFPNRVDSTFSFDKDTRTFTIEPISESYDVYFKTNKYTKSDPESVVIPNVTGLYFIFFDSSGQLAYSTSFPGLKNMIYISYVYWNADQATAALQFGPGDERHGTVMDKDTHERLHSVDWTQWVSGLQIYDATLDDDSDNDATKVSITNGIVADEDLRHSITHSDTPAAFFEQILQGFAQLPVMYREGTNGAWKQDEATEYPYKNTTSGRINYNEWDETEWKQTQVGNGDFVSYYIAFTADVEQPIKVIQGQRFDTTLEAAQANNDDRDIQWGDTPFQEYKILYRLIFQTSDSYTSDRKAALRDVLDLRAAKRAPGGGGIIPSAHPNLTGLDYASSGHTGFAKSATNMDVDQFRSDYLSGADSPLAYNLLPDSGRFVPTGTPLTITTTAPFAANPFFTPHNGSSAWISAGKFTHINGGVMEQTVIDLVDKMELLGLRNEEQKNFGTEFYVAQSTMGSGTSSPHNGRYRFTSNPYTVLTHSQVSVGFWVKVASGNDIEIPSCRKNMSSLVANYLISESDGWTYITKTSSLPTGYSNGYPEIYANAGTVIQIALPAVVPGGIGLGWITSPMPSIVSPIYTADGTFTATLQNGWTGTLTYSKNYLGQVTLIGNITAGTITQGTIIANLPTGYRPRILTPFAVLSMPTGDYGGRALFAHTNGNIVVPINANLVAAQNIQFEYIFTTSG